MRFNSAGYNKFIIATVDNKGSQMYYYGYAKLEHYGGHLNPTMSRIEWIPNGTVKRSAQYPTFEDEITSGQNEITEGSSSV